MKKQYKNIINTVLVLAVSVLPFAVDAGRPGSVEDTFNAFNGIPKAMDIHSTGNLVIGGLFTSYNGTPAAGNILLDSEGEVLSTLGTPSPVDVTDVAFQSDGDIVILGNFSEYNGQEASKIVLIDDEGVLITDIFYPGSTMISVDNLNNIYIVGENEGEPYITKYDPTGLIEDDDFASNTLDLFFDGSIYDLIPLDSGKIIVGGNFTGYFVPGGKDPEIAYGDGITRLNADGSHDPTFGSDGSEGFDGDVTALAIDANGKILAGGLFDNYNGVSAPGIVRLNTDGSIDNSFSLGTGFGVSGVFGSENITSIKVDSNGKIYVAGYFETFNGENHQSLIRLNSDGTIDTTFDIGDGPSPEFASGALITELVLTSEDNIVATGNFNTFDNNPAGKIAEITGGIFIEEDAGEESTSTSGQVRRITYACKDPKATNYSPFGRHQQSECRYGGTQLATTIGSNESSSDEEAGSCINPLTQNLKQGDRDGNFSSYAGAIVTQVSQLQDLLGILSDGIFGPQTAAAVRSFQLRSELGVDGVVGPQTRTELNADCSVQT